MPSIRSLYVVVFAATAITLLLPAAKAITCYQCSSTDGQDCKTSSETCNYGLFGCYKLATYSGGVDKFGNFYDEENRIITMTRGCTLLPITGADACQQHSVLGVRMVTCYCFNDFCNSTVSMFHKNHKLLALLIINLFIIRILNVY